MNKVTRLRTAGLVYFNIRETDDAFRRKIGFFWKIYILLRLITFSYSLKEKLAIIIKRIDKENKFFEELYKKEYELLEDYYKNEKLNEIVAFSPNKKYYYENLRCLFSVLNEIFNEDIYRIKDLIKNKDKIFDIGANIGIYSLAVKEFFPDTKIIAFEPSRESYCVCQKNLKGYKGIIIKNLAVGESVKKTLLLTYASNISNKIDGDFHTDFKIEPIKKDVINMISLDSLKDKVDVIKIDVEGYEENVLLGAIKTINKFKPIIICAIEHSKDQRSRLIKLLKENAPFYDVIDLNFQCICFYVEEKHRDRIKKIIY